jgi:DNA polymerase-3 subunit gamma/tau
VIHASQLPDPGELARRLAEGGVAPVAAAPATPAPAPAPPTPVQSRVPATFEELVARLDGDGALALAARLHNGARVVRYAPPELVLSGSRPMAADTVAELIAALKQLTGQAWRVSFDDVPGTPTLKEQEDAAAEAKRLAIWESPMIRAAREAFPDTVLEDWPGKRRLA